MPVDKMICKFNPETQKCEWTNYSDALPPSVAPAVEGVKHIKAVGLEGQPVFESRKSYERAVREAGCVVVGNDPAGMAPPHRRDEMGLTHPGEASRRHRR